MARTSRRGQVKARRKAARLLKVGAALAKTAERTGEMNMAAVQTIGIRTGMLMRAAGDPVAMADPEFTRMVSEKVEAVMASGLAMGAGLPSLQAAWTAWLSSQAAITGYAMAELAQCRSPLDIAAVHSRMVEALQSAGTAAGTRLAEAALDVTGAGMAPVHKAVSANARRLTRKKQG